MDSIQKHPYMRTPARPTASTALWGHLLRKTGSSQVPSSSATSTTTLGKNTQSIAPLDKAGASTRILLHDTQAHLERFTDRVTELTGGVCDTKRELIAVQKLYQDEHEAVLDRITGLTNRCQTELQKQIGSPAQTSEIREVAKDMSYLSSRLEALDKKIDSLNSLNQNQSYALQAIQDQQGQLLIALAPILPLLQTVPLHVENARDRVKNSLAELRHEIATRDLQIAKHMSCSHGSDSGVSKSSRTRSSSLAVLRERTPSGRKKRRLDNIFDGLQGQDVPPKTTDALLDICDGNTDTALDAPFGDRNLASATSLGVPLAPLHPRLAALDTPTPPGSNLHTSTVAATPRSRPSLRGTLYSNAVSRILPSGTIRRSSRLSSKSNSTSLAMLPGSPTGTRLGMTVLSGPGIHQSCSTSVNTPSPPLLKASSVGQDASQRVVHLPCAPSTLTAAAHGHGYLSITTQKAFNIPLRPSSAVVMGEQHAPDMPPPTTHGKPLSIKHLRAMAADDQQASFRLEPRVSS
ncbi:hypothetical protein BC628DRAFT_1351874 [Trametes gibbosa]|nr:hypothetical protein BC628DRAFT_1351874 [Trametes gibbosa]